MLLQNGHIQWGPQTLNEHMDHHFPLHFLFQIMIQPKYQKTRLFFFIFQFVIKSSSGVFPGRKINNTLDLSELKLILSSDIMKSHILLANAIIYLSRLHYFTIAQMATVKKKVVLLFRLHFGISKSAWAMVLLNLGSPYGFSHFFILRSMHLMYQTKLMDKIHIKATLVQSLMTPWKII